MHSLWVNTLRPRQICRHFADDIFKCILWNENARISLKFSPKLVPKMRINNIPALVQMMAWRRSDDKPLSEQMMISLLTHICVTRPHWGNVRCFVMNYLCNKITLVLFNIDLNPWRHIVKVHIQSILQWLNHIHTVQTLSRRLCPCISCYIFSVQRWLFQLIS